MHSLAVLWIICRFCDVIEPRMPFQLNLIGFSCHIFSQEITTENEIMQLHIVLIDIDDVINNNESWWIIGAKCRTDEQIRYVYWVSQSAFSTMTTTNCTILADKIRNSFKYACPTSVCGCSHYFESFWIDSPLAYIAMRWSNSAHM